MELQPDFARAHEMLGSTYDLLSRFDEANEPFLKTWSYRRTTDSLSTGWHARACEAAGRLSEAEDAFERARRVGFPPKKL